MPGGPATPNDPLVVFLPSGQRRRIPVGTTILDAARAAGVEIESICGGRQTCGRCQVVIERGAFPKEQITCDEASVTPAGPVESELLERRGRPTRRLSCAARANGDLVISVPDEAQGRKQVVRKAAGRQIVEVAPPIRQVYVTVEEASLDDQRGDWERLRDALSAQWGLDDLTIDPFVLRDLQRTLRAGKWAVTVTIRSGTEVVDCRPGYTEGCYGVAVDIGTTTIAAHLCDLRTGEVLATETVGNPQIAHGEDLMSRVSYAMRDDTATARLQESLRTGLNELIQTACARAGSTPQDVCEVVTVGNTVMQQSLLGIDPTELGGAPFALATHDAVDVKARDLGLEIHPAAYVHVPPSVAGHVGADNVAVLVAEAPHEREETTLVVDVGTNGEVLLGHGGVVWSASSPTGPAFEGAQVTHGMRAAPGAIERVRIDPMTGEVRFKVVGAEAWSTEGAALPASGICGSGIIEAVAQLYLAGVVDAGGRFRADRAGPRWQAAGRVPAYVLATADQTTTGAEIVVTQQDVRAVQLAKAALYTATRLLMERAGVDRVERIVLAGAFGSYIDPFHAMVLGLVPDCDLEQVHAVGNAAGDGARILLLDERKRAEASRRARDVRYVEIAVAPGFQDAFVSAMAIPHAEDAFPHLDGQLPAPRAAGRPARGRRTHSRTVARSAP